MSFDFSNKIVMITGANSGIGYAIARNFLEDQATVILPIHRNGSNIEKLVYEFGRERVHELRLDLQSIYSIDQSVNKIEKEFGHLDILVNNAGVSRPVPLEEISEETWNEVFDTNIKGTFFLTQKSFHLIKRAGGGSVVNISSMSGHEPYPGMGAYSASKAALNMITKQLAIEWAPHHIRVNAVSPGLIRTPLSEQLYKDQEIHRKRAALVPLNRIGTSEEIAYVVSFLCSSKASYMTGQTVLVDGGLIGTIQNQIVGRPTST